MKDDILYIILILVIEYDHGKVIHNCSQDQIADDFKNGEEIVRDLLTRLVTLMKGIHLLHGHNWL